MKYTIGIDNGKMGGLVVLDESKNIYHRKVMPLIGTKKKEYDINELYDWLNLYKDQDVICYLEKAQPQGNNGAKQAFTTGYGYGVIQGLLTALNIPFQIVAPKTWQKKVFEGLNKDDTKLASELFCKRKWPKEDWRATERSKKAHDGLTDGACIAYYGATYL